MCRSFTEGGRRCAAQTRPAFHAAIGAVNTARSRREQRDAQVRGLDAVAFHAATPTGRVEVAALSEYAVLCGDETLAAFLDAGQRMAVGVREGFARFEAEVAAEQSRAAGVSSTHSPAVGAVAVGPDAGTGSVEDWDPGHPATDVAEHWSIAKGGDRWHAGGCGAFAIAMTERWPHLKIACEVYHDHGAESVAHAWAYDPATGHRFHVFGAEPWQPTTQPDYDPDSHRVLLDQSPGDVRRLFRGFNTSEDTVYDAFEVVCEMFDPDYVPDPEAGEFDRNHLYF